jgi:hypothetical protein
VFRSRSDTGFVFRPTKGPPPKRTRADMTWLIA